MRLGCPAQIDVIDRLLVPDLGTVRPRIVQRIAITVFEKIYMFARCFFEQHPGVLLTVTNHLPPIEMNAGIAGGVEGVKASPEKHELPPSSGLLLDERR